MSAGERSCFYFANGCPRPKHMKKIDMEFSFKYCNVDCKWYEHDGVSQPDTISIFKLGNMTFGGDFTKEITQPLNEVIEKANKYDKIIEWKKQFSGNYDLDEILDELEKLDDICT